MVQVYSVSSSSRTVQLYSRSRFLMLPLMNRLNIFPANRCSASVQDTMNSTRAMRADVTLTASPGPPRGQQPQIEPPRRAPSSSR
ncbi:hypothetical protein F2P81_026412 [Scophthalmus maximus]|uniref:Uncharacterized protein n=1 Tax=Scophthalmus maximus TaxID=52904 RepID=A0A6A4RLY5_SCOMX|nr:hypothetical protein F2P81_026412 [Scophthalmus maximus]